MKTRIFLLTLCLVLAVTMQAQTYDPLWKRVEQMELKDLPKSVIAEAEKIYVKAKSERNVPQMMKAYLTMMVYRESISPDSLAVDVKGLEEWAASPLTEVQDRAVLYSILGGEVDEPDQRNEYLRLSLKDSLTLVDYAAEKLVPMVKTGETSRLYFNNNLYDLLARRAIGLWDRILWIPQRETAQESVRQTWQSLLHIYKEKNMRPAWLLTALDAYPQADEKLLREWMKEYADLDVCAEVYLRLAERMLGQDEPARRLALLQEGIKRYPNYNRINALKNEEKEILAPFLEFGLQYAYPDEPICLHVPHRNLSGFTMKVYRLSLSSESLLLAKVGPKTVTKYGKLVGEEHFDLPPTPDYRLRRDTVRMKPLEVGIYYAVAVPDGHRNEVQGSLVYVSSLQVLHRALPQNRQEMVVLDKRSGHPVADAQIDVYEATEKGYTLKESHRANDEGVVMLPKDGDLRIYYQARTSTDAAMPLESTWLGRNDYKPSDKTQEHVSLFTDRSLYRPGQTLHYSGIAYTQRKDEAKVKAGSTYTVTLLDADRREVAKQEVKTDEFGTFQGTFELPKSGKMGVYRLQTDKGSMTFRVEAYKRPTFDVTFDDVKTVYRPGDSIRVTGTARTFAGAPVQGARVSYQVVRHELSFWRMHGMATHRVAGETVTDAEGRFEVPVHFLPIANEGKYWSYTYEVSADVTNLAGETQSGTLSLPLGSSSLRLYIPDWEGETLIKEQRKELTFRVTNLTNTPIETDVDYQVWSQGKPVAQGRATSNKPFVPEAIYALPSGSYQLKATVTDEAGKKNEQTVSFVLLSLNDKRLPEGVENWCYQSGDEFDADGQATIYFGSQEKDVYLFYDVMYGDNRMERKRISFSDSILTFRYTYQEAYGDGLRCSFAYLKNGELYVRNLYIKKPKPDKALLLKWKTFRDKLQPGQKETWTLSVHRPDGKPADAQLMATMYDASLDKLASHDWRFGLNFARSFPNVSWRYERDRQVWWNFSFAWKRLKCPPLEYSRLEIPSTKGFVLYESEIRRITGSPMMMKASANRAMVASDAVTEASAQEDLALEETGDVQLRTNFAETAFFYPQLRTDAGGEVNIEFTLPESLTEWKFMGLAHTRDMDYGSIMAKAVASKEFMLQPNLPRFVRVGDDVNVAASLVNLSDKEVKGIVRMEIFVPETEQVILSQKRPFKVKAGETGKVSFGFDVSGKYEGLAVRMVADGGAFSDGEQRYLPVLSNKQKLTESVLLNVNGEGTYTFSLESLFNHHSKTVSRPQMTVEFTGNPMWYAVQALKVVANPDTDNALSWASATYANSLLAHLAKTEPRIADSLKVEGLDAKLAESILKMKDLQLADGSWSWFKGMDGSRYMTTAITQLLARLQRMTGDLTDIETKWMYRQAMGYLDKQAAAEVRWMKEAEKKDKQQVEPSEWALQYLYLLALDARLDTETGRYLVDKLAKMPTRLTIYGKALGAIILQEAGEKVKAKEFLESLMQYSVMTEEMGRYFDTPKAEYSWFSYKIPTQVAAIEAVKKVANEEKTQEEMKQWLLKQKQAQVWDTPIATTDAVYALLTTGRDWLANTGEGKILMSEGKNKIREDEIRFGEGGDKGYVKQEVTGDVTAIREVTVVKSSAGIGWGAVYAEFEEDMDQVSSQGNALQVSRILLKDGKPLADGELLQVGHRLTVRLTVTADRDMDFVQVKDERAACMEPVDALSGYRWADGIGYYQETKDASTTFYLDKVRKGTHELTYEVYVTSSGMYQQGIPTARSVYAPEFGGHGGGGSVIVE